MIKNLIFDLDNTLIKSEKTDALSYKNVLSKYGYDSNFYIDIYDCIDKYEKTRTDGNSKFDKYELCDFINKELYQNYKIELVEDLIDSVGKEWIKEVLIEEEVIKKLSEKYDLYVYTNFFQDAQEKRLQNIGYLKYFKKVFGSDYYGCKPFKKSILKVLQEIGTTPEECIMIGDSKQTDILAASKIGMRSILVDYNGRRDIKEIIAENYTVIDDINQLEKML